MEYRFKTTFWSDFSIADRFGIEAIKDTYRRAFQEWRTDYIYLTELAMVMNWKCWYYFEKDDEKCQLYSELYYNTRDYALDNLKGKELKYYIETTD